MTPTQRAGLEALLFLADEPVPATVLSEAVGVEPHEIDDACQRLAEDLRAGQRGVTVRRVADGWRMYTAEVAWPVVEQHVLAGRTGRLSTAALETLAVIAYKQPITRGAIGEVRGVNPDGAVRSLVARGYVEEVGREETPGQPVLYGTTTRMLEELGLDSLDQLPELTDHMPEDDAPDEPDDLRAARKLLAGGGSLPSTGAGRWSPGDDEDDDAGAEPVTRGDDGGLGPPREDAAAAREDDRLEDLTGRVEAAARSAMDQLRAAVDATERATATPDDGPSDPAADDPSDPAADDPSDA